MFPSGTFRMSWHFCPWCTTFRNFSGHFGDTARKCLGNRKTGNILNELNIYPKCPENFPKAVHHGQKCQDILNVPLGNIFGAPFWFILNFTDWEHCDRTTRNITKVISNEPLGNIQGTFFGKIQGVPMVFLNRTSWSHDLVNCECTGHFPSMSHSGTLQVLSLGKFKMYPCIT